MKTNPTTRPPIMFGSVLTVQADRAITKAGKILLS